MTEKLNRSKRRKMNTRKKIVRASYKTLSEKGLFRATLDEITKEADVGKGTIFYHFKDRLDLLSHLTKKSIEELLDYCKKKIAGIEDPYELIKKLVNAHFTFFEKKRALFNILFFIRGVLHQDLESRYQKEIHGYYRKYIHFLAEKLTYGVKTGVFRDVNPMNQAYILHGIITGFISQWIINGRKGSFASKKKAVADTFLHGITSNEKSKEK